MAEFEELIAALQGEMAVLFRRMRRDGAIVAHEVHPRLEPSAYLVMLYLAECGPMRLTTLANLFHVGKATMSRHLKALDDLGLLDRERDPCDGRASLLKLTEDGRRRLREAEQSRRVPTIEALRSWSPEDLRTFVALLARFNSAVDAPA